MEDALRQRIKRLLEQKSISIYQMAKTYNLNQKTLNNQINAETQISASTILHVLKEFPDISSEWLLRGEGNMLKPQPETTYTTQPSLINTEAGTPEASALYQIHNDMIKLTRELVEENTKLKLQISELSQSENEIANILKDFRDSNKELSEKNRELTIELMIKDAQIREKEKSNSDYKEILKEAI